MHMLNIGINRGLYNYMYSIVHCPLQRGESVACGLIDKFLFCQLAFVAKNIMYLPGWALRQSHLHHMWAPSYYANKRDLAVHAIYICIHMEL